MPEMRLALRMQPEPAQLAYVEQALRASFRVGAVRVDGAELVVEHDPQEAQPLQAALQRLLFVAKSVHRDLIFHHDVPIAHRDDPQPALQASRQVIPVQPGFFSFQGDFLRVLKALDAATLEMARALDAVEQEHPAVWPVRLFRMIDYFHEFPQQMILCAPVKEDHATRALFARLHRREGGRDTVPMDEHMAEASYGLQPAVCDCCYYVLEGSREHRDTVYTTANKVFRNERSPTRQLDRLTNFTVRDIMFVGAEPFVLETRQRLIECLQGFLVALALNARIETANDPFFANDSAMKSVFQNAHRLKYELLARIPHLQRDIAIGSINLHTDFFGKAFDIRLAGGGVAHSGCIGVGMERTAYALFCQHGPQLQHWPAPVREFLRL